MARRKPAELVFEEDAAPADPLETPEQIIARLERELAEEKAAHARTRAAHAAQATIIRAQRAELERLNREKYAEWRLRRSKLKSAQVDTFMAIARVGTKRADWLDKDAPVITGANLAGELGVHESTARANAEAVCNLPGSPIRRTTEYRTDGKRGQLTSYELRVRDPVELIEQMVVVAEALDAPTSTRPRPLRCPEHPNARVNVYTQHECSRCGAVLRSDLPDAKPLCEEVTRIGEDAPSVDGSVLIPVQPARMGALGPDDPAAERFREAVRANGNGNGHHDPDRAAADLVAIPLGDGHPPPTPANGHASESGNGSSALAIGPPVAAVPAVAWRCYACTSDRREQTGDGDWRCAGCRSRGVPPPRGRP
jgi:DNA-directed RNA polymerase subunit RPC12/RpoP